MKKRIVPVILPAVVLLLCSFSLQGDEALQARADALHKKIFSIDTHNDTAIATNHPNASYGVTKGQVSFKMMKEGGLDAAMFAIYLEQGPLDDASVKKATQYAIDEINMFKKYISEHSDEAEIAYCADDFLPVKKSGKSAVMFAIENGYAIGRNIENVELFYNMGVRLVVLSHNYNNDICDSSRDSVSRWGGLSPFGYKVVGEMNRLGMIIDVSHTSTATLFDCIEASKTPIIASHSGVWNLKHNPRNLKDEEIKAIAAKGGVIQVGTGKFFISDKPKAEVTVSDLCDHIDYIKNLVGPQYVGIGTDFDGGGGVVGLENVSKMKNITIELMRRGWSDKELEMFWGANYLRVLRQVENYARKGELQ